MEAAKNETNQEWQFTGDRIEYVLISSDSDGMRFASRSNKERFEMSNMLEKISKWQPLVASLLTSFCFIVVGIWNVSAYKTNMDIAVQTLDKRMAKIEEKLEKMPSTEVMENLLIKYSQGVKEDISVIKNDIDWIKKKQN